MLQVNESLTEVKFVSMSFWFWVKAGIGIAIGMGMVVTASWLLWLLFFVNLLMGVMRGGVRH